MLKESVHLRLLLDPEMMEDFHETPDDVDHVLLIPRSGGKFRKMKLEGLCGLLYSYELS